METQERTIFKFFFFQSCLRRRPSLPQLAANQKLLRLHLKMPCLCREYLNFVLSLLSSGKIQAKDYVSQVKELGPSAVVVSAIRWVGEMLAPFLAVRKKLLQQLIVWLYAEIIQCHGGGMSACFCLLRSKVSTTCALKERRNGNWKIRKPENPFQQKDTSSARRCCVVSLPLLKPQAM